MAEPIYLMQQVRALKLLAIGGISLAGVAVILPFILGGNGEKEALKALGAQVRTLTKETESLIKSVDATRKDLDRQRIVNRAQASLIEELMGSEFVEVALIGKGYTAVNVSQGRLLVSVEDAAPYLSGTKIKLRIGNPMLMTLNGISGSVQYGTAPPKDALAIGEGAYETWNANLAHEAVSVVDAISPGRWNIVEITLRDANPSQLGYMAIKLTADNVSLGR